MWYVPLMDKCYAILQHLLRTVSTVVRQRLVRNSGVFRSEVLRNPIYYPLARCTLAPSQSQIILYVSANAPVCTRGNQHSVSHLNKLTVTCKPPELKH